MPSLAPAAVSVRDLRKSFRPGKPALAGLNLHIDAGTFFVLLGANGAGKTTALRSIVGLCRADAGTIEVFGIDIRRDPLAARRVVAWLPDEPQIYDKLDPLENLEFVAGLWNVSPTLAEPRAVELLNALGLWAERRMRCEGFSRGMKQKVALAGALIHEPQLLVLDEPLTGLDAASARVVKDLLRQHTSRGGAVLLTTHILEVAERLADRIGIIDQGRLVAEGTCAELVRSNSARDLEETFLALTGARAAA